MRTSCVFNSHSSLPHTPGAATCLLVLQRKKIHVSLNCDSEDPGWVAGLPQWPSEPCKGRWAGCVGTERSHPWGPSGPLSSPTPAIHLEKAWNVCLRAKLSFPRIKRVFSGLPLTCSPVLPHVCFELALVGHFGYILVGIWKLHSVKMQRKRVKTCSAWDWEASVD